jgi:SAM-dependent methyltransferase
MRKRVRDYKAMTAEQLRATAKQAHKRELAAPYAKGRRGWKSVWQAAEEELQRRERSADPGRRREELRQTFETVAELYDRVRPTYPDELFDDLALSIRSGGRVLEIGPGTGQATLPLAERGFDIVAVELGTELAAFAREKLEGFPKVEIVNGDFERWSSDRRFDAVVAFTAFHWIDPAMRYTKPAALLRPGGVLAVTEVMHVRVPDDDPFWVDVQHDYDAVVPSPDNRPPPRVEDVGDLRSEIEASDLFADVDVRRYVWQVTYSPDEYIDVLRTYSPNIARDPAISNELFRRIRARIQARDHPRVAKSYLATMNIARATVPPPNS